MGKVIRSSWAVHTIWACQATHIVLLYDLILKSRNYNPSTGTILVNLIWQTQAVQHMPRGVSSAITSSLSHLKLHELGQGCLASPSSEFSSEIRVAMHTFAVHIPQWIIRLLGESWACVGREFMGSFIRRIAIATGQLRYEREGEESDGLSSPNSMKLLSNDGRSLQN